jgi:hypothetical protein
MVMSNKPRVLDPQELWRKPVRSEGRNQRISEKSKRPESLLVCGVEQTAFWQR